MLTIGDCRSTQLWNGTRKQPAAMLQGATLNKPYVRCLQQVRKIRSCTDFTIDRIDRSCKDLHFDLTVGKRRRRPVCVQHKHRRWSGTAKCNCFHAHKLLCVVHQPQPKSSRLMIQQTHKLCQKLQVFSPCTCTCTCTCKCTMPVIAFITFLLFE